MSALNDLLDADQVDSGYSEPLELAEAAAARKGLVVVHPSPNELFIDIDDTDSLATFDVNIGILRDIEPLVYTQRPSPSGKPGRWHITVELLRPLKNPLERIMLQALLGSDPHHEMLSYKSAVGGCTTPTLFFERPEVAAE